MEENKKYWYIKLNVNFFEDDRIDWLCDQQNGFAYVVLYLKLCLKTANNNGILTRQIGDMIIPYDVEKIAEMTHINVDIVRVALELYKKTGLIYEADENCSFMRLPEVPSMVGYVTQSALTKRKQREKKQLGILDSGSQNRGSLEDNVQDNVPQNVQDNVQQELRVKSKELRVKSIKKESACKRTTSAFVPPTLEEVEAYARSRNSSVDPKRFWDYFDAGNWVDAKGQPVRSWKQKFITWEKSQQDTHNQSEHPKRFSWAELAAQMDAEEGIV